MKNCAEAGVTKKLPYFLPWIIQGPRTLQTPQRTRYIELYANWIAQHIPKCYKSDRQILYQPKHAGSTGSSLFRSRYEMPPAIGLLLHSHHMHHSRTDINLLNAANVGVSYNRSNVIATHLANNSIKIMQKNNGAYIPPQIIKGIPVRDSADNVDMRVDTPDGRGTFHGTAVSAYQRLLPDALSNTNDELFSEMLDTADTTDLVHDIPSTILHLHPCPICAGSQRPHASPHYENYKLGKPPDRCYKCKTTRFIVAANKTSSTPKAFL